jgi:hypothetical protein
MASFRRSYFAVKASSKFDFSKIKRKITNQINITREDLDVSPRNSPRGSERDDGLGSNKKERRDTASSAGLASSKGKEKERRATGSPRAELAPSPRSPNREEITNSTNSLTSSGTSLSNSASIPLAASTGALSPRPKERRNAQADLWSLSPRTSEPMSPRSRNSETPDSPRGGPPKTIGKPPMTSSHSSPNLIVLPNGPSDKQETVNKTQPLFRKPSNNNFRINLISSADGVDPADLVKSRDSTPRDTNITPRDAPFNASARSPRLEMSSNRYRFVSEGAPIAHVVEPTLTVTLDEPKPSEPLSLSNGSPRKPLPVTPRDKERLSVPGEEEKEIVAPESIKVLSPRAVRILKPEGGARARFCSDGHYDEDASSASNRLVRSPRSPRRANDPDTVRVMRVRQHNGTEGPMAENDTVDMTIDALLADEV